MTIWWCLAPYAYYALHSLEMFTQEGSLRSGRLPASISKFAPVNSDLFFGTQMKIFSFIFEKWQQIYNPDQIKSCRQGKWYFWVQSVDRTNSGRYHLNTFERVLPLFGLREWRASGSQHVISCIWHLLSNREERIKKKMLGRFTA